MPAREPRSAIAIKEFGERVRRLRLELGLTQEQLAEATGLHRTYVGSLERGERNIALLNILRVAQGVDTEPGELVSGLTI